MRRLRELQMMAGLRKTSQERRTERMLRSFRREQALAEQKMLLVDRIKEREGGAIGTRPMPLARKHE